MRVPVLNLYRGELTDEHAASSYGMPVCVIKGPRGDIVDPRDGYVLLVPSSTPPSFIAAAKAAGYTVRRVDDHGQR